MENEKKDRKDKAHLEKHSLPGTNQAGVGPEVPADKIRDESDAEPPRQDLDPHRPESADRGGPKTAP
jgi:hypothetical protein